MTIVGAGARATIIRGYPQVPDRVFQINAVASATISHLTMRDGASDNNGGNLRNEGTVVLDHVRVTNGSTSGDGGGLANLNGTMTIRHSLIDHNGAYAGGGIFNYGGDGGAPGRLTVTDSTIAANSAVRAGALATQGNVANTTRLERVTVTRNEATDGSPAGIDNDPDSGGVVRVRGSILAFNIEFGEDVNCAGTPPISEGGNVSSTTECSLTGPGDLQGVDAQVSATPVPAGGETDTYPVAAGSPAIDRFACSGSDQRDVTRPQGSACDSGRLRDRPAPGHRGRRRAHVQLAGARRDVRVRARRHQRVRRLRLAVQHRRPGSRDVHAAGASGRRGRAAGSVARGARVHRARPASDRRADAHPHAGVQRNRGAPPRAGTVRVREPGSSRFVELEEGASVPIGSTVDTKKGKIELTSIAKRGEAPQTATFFDGIFKIVQAKGYTELQLTEKLAPCKQARAAAAKPKTRKLWGDGKGKFRTRGTYSAATVRGTKWLVQDSCAGTLTRVTQGSCPSATRSEAQDRHRARGQALHREA